MFVQSLYILPFIQIYPIYIPFFILKTLAYFKLLKNIAVSTISLSTAILAAKRYHSCRLTKNWIILSSVLNSGPIFPTRQKIWRKREVNMTWETINQYFVIILLFGDYFNCHIVTITVTLEWKLSSCLPWKYKSFTLYCIQIFKEISTYKVS